MPVLAAQVTLQMTTGVPADAVVNTFHFTDTSTPAGVTNIQTFLQNWLVNIKGLLSSSVAQNGHSIKIYDLNDPLPRAPVADLTYNYSTSVSGSPLPHQVAMVASFQGDRISGVPQARRRGRVYVGPLNTGNVSTGGRVASASIASLNTAASALSTAATASTTAWGVWSPTSGQFTEITNGWCDDTFDIQRRRQRTPLVRTTW